MKSSERYSIIITAVLIGVALTLPASAASTPAASAAIHQAATAAAATAVTARGHHHGHLLSFGLRFPYFIYGHRPHHYGYHRYRYGYHRYGYYPRYRLYRGDERLGGLDLNVRPKKAEVYVDGKYIGVAGQYDGWPSYLWLEEGTHQIILFREGYGTVARELEIRSDLVADLRVRMAAGEAISPEELVPASSAPTESPEAATGPGRLRVSITPDDAVIYLDGHFFGIASELAQVRAGLSVESGKHTVEVVRPGYRSAKRTIDVDPGAQLDLELKLDQR